MMNRTVTASARADGLTPEVADAIEAMCQCSMVRAGEVVYSIDEPADSIYFVLSGRLQGVLPSEQGAHRVIGEVGRGHAVGLMALLDNQTYATTIVAIRDSRVARLSSAQYEELGLKHPELMLKIARYMLQVTRDLVLGGSFSTDVGTVVLVPVDDAVPVHEIAGDLAAALSEHGSATVATSALRDDISRSTRADDRADALLDRLEEVECRNDFVVYAGSAGDPDWERVCLARADRVLLVADATSSDAARAGACDRLCNFQESSITRCDLVLLHGAEEPSGTLAWLEGAAFDRWYHVNPKRKDDCARLARWLAGKAVGLVLSGGGARGFAHLGVVRAMREAGIPIDAIAGTSMGGIMGALAACEWDYATMVDAVTRTFVRSKPLRDFTIPLVSFVSGKRISRLLQETLGDRRIEDLPIPFMCVSCNLSKAEAAYHTRGPLWRALRATIAIPAVIAPTVSEGDVHVDGGAIDNMPVRAMRELGVRTVIAVDVSPLDRFASNLPDTDSLLRPPFFADLLHGRRSRDKRTPGLLAILRRSGSVSAMALQRKAQTEADRSIGIQLEGVRMLDWQRLEEIAGIGYETARGQIAGWPKEPC